MRVLPRKKLKPKKFAAEWAKITANCSSRKQWPNAVIQADKLLDKALKRKGYKGKATGEKLVAAQHDLKFNEEVWFAHKLSKKLAENEIDVRTLKKKDILMAMAGIREALRDIGALENGHAKR
ncbi:MAG TPA: hypothetical protein VL989_02900 [Candidatus Sulfotelmatobacter sp.]|nr:hypothetical protein [Candidatus Sulfotelmatobacter sp.]